MTVDFSSKISAVKRSEMERMQKIPNRDPLMCLALRKEYSVLKRFTNHRVIVSLPEGGACYANFDRRGFWILDDIDGLVPRREDRV